LQIRLLFFIRHSSLTTALEHSNGNYQKVQTLSRHASLDTIKIYDDNQRAIATTTRIIKSAGGLDLVAGDRTTESFRSGE
jgi:hypothetical protein